MKTKVIVIMLLISSIMYSQKSKKNGTVYNEHPAIAVVESFMQAFYAGDADKAGNYLADDFKSYQGTTLNKDAEGRDKEWTKNASKWVKENWSYISHQRSPGAFPDAIEYDGDTGVWVQTWDHFKAMDNATGVQYDMPIHRLFQMTADNTIKLMLIYDNDLPWLERRSSFAPRTNGVIYNNHDNINTIRLYMGALANGDVDKAFSYFTEDATFTDLDMKRGESRTVEEEKEMFKGLTSEWNITSIDVRGYPDYLEYELGGAKVVQSWWDVRMTKKSDDKIKVILPILLINDFNDEGKMTQETGYYTTKSME